VIPLGGMWNWGFLACAQTSEPGPREADPARRINPAVTYSRPEGLPSAGTGLTSVFGMGTGVAPPEKPPERPKAPRGARYSIVKGCDGRRMARGVRPEAEEGVGMNSGKGLVR
jgi:hypothetical protein